MGNEKLDKEHTEIINNIVNEMINIIRSKVPNSKYTEYNLVMNVLTGCMSRMMQQLPSDDRYSFISLVIKSLKANKDNFERLGI